MVVTIRTLWLNVFFPFLFIVTNDGCESPCDGVLRREAFKYTDLLGQLYKCVCFKARCAVFDIKCVEMGKEAVKMDE